ncbi:arylamine N-acetyltransferase family protein [Evtepia sp.]|uniref:arylamine N-acetyltransferase family protein n=1 Tax=Evtepia sp. TaxID=2773933 RepID=UPI002A805443|nr:arylamine N-acetyltransferase [Evtepia sp.]MDY4430198.1 arylamine N-acetyltransferase [Evtepia sp.]
MIDYNAYNGPKMTREQMDAYLARIGVKEPVTLNLAGLTRIHQAHQQTVPFENLDILADKPLSLDHEALFDKIVTRRRGGVCAELNTIYNWLLYSLGFQVTSYNARIASQGGIQFRRHRVLGVTLEGKVYTTDVGFTTEMARRPLLLKEGLVQYDGFCGYEYRRDPFYGWLLLQKCPGEDWKPSLGFTQEPQIDLDFETPMFYYEKSPNSNINQIVRVAIYTSAGILAIRHSCLLEEWAGLVQKSTPIASREEEIRLARDLFGLDANG